MTIEPFSPDDIAPFLELAAAERWVAEEWEFRFLLSEFPQGCFAAHRDGRAVGFVTSLRHDRGGWIGNLIVEYGYRGKNIGERLFSRACEALRTAGAETVWLTASKSGMPLYEKHGFTRIDTIIRWVGAGRRHQPADRHRSDRDAAGTSACGIDRLAWGDRREALLAVTAARGRLLLEESGFAVVQPCGGAWQLGPFTALDSGAAERNFTAALDLIPHGEKICLDSPASNRAGLRMFNRKRFRVRGSTELMYAGRKPEYRPELLYALATMGSCG